MAEWFPPARTLEEFEALRKNEDALRPGVSAIRDRHHLGGAPIERFPEGSLPVYAVGEDLVLKLYPPFDLGERDTESAALRAVQGRLPIPTPAVHAVGALDGWGYVLMDRLKGVGLAEAWPGIPERDQLALADTLGESLAALHAIPAPGISPLPVGWSEFIAGQRAGAVDRQRSRGLQEPWLSQIRGFLDRTPMGKPGHEVLLHTEVMREHLLVEKRSGRWKLTGLFDFEPAMPGAPEYEFAAVGLFFSCGDPRLLRRVFAAYSYLDSELDAALERRLLAYGLLHRYSNFVWYLQRMPPPTGTATLESLAALWWGVRPA